MSEVVVNGSPVYLQHFTSDGLVCKYQNTVISDGS